MELLPVFVGLRFVGEGLVMLCEWSVFEPCVTNEMYHVTYNSPFLRDDRAPPRRTVQTTTCTAVRAITVPEGVEQLVENVCCAGVVVQKSVDLILKSTRMIDSGEYHTSAEHYVSCGAPCPRAAR